MSRTFWITLFIAFANSLSFTILIPILYLYGRQFGLNDFQTSLLFATYAGSQFFATPVIGKLSDRFGRKPLLIISLTGTVIANFLAGTASHASMLFFARFLDGITGGNISVAQAIISDITPPEGRARAFGMFGAVTFGLGFVVGPAVSLLAQQFSLGTGFLVSSAIASIALLATITNLPETLRTKADKARNIFDLGLGNLITGLVMPKVGIMLIINFLIGTTFTIFTFAFQPYYIQVLGQNSTSLTLLFITFGTLSVAMQVKGIALLTDRISLVNILFLGLSVRSLSFLLMPAVPNIVYFAIVSSVFALFNALVQPMVSTLISLNAKPEAQGTVMGLNASYLNVSNAFGPIIAGIIVNQTNPITYSYPLYLAGALTFSVLLFAIATRRQYAPIPTS
ncbi:MFS transporter [Microseira wollei]|uniref:Major facilitator superfamily MFS_1 n=1 Tax=Microseira wollei NIES-4236 TaxID=2530354 RepID=A0AAV3X2W9_9CYAN|nr:MFS transporter [Microseira wollei]GET35623.1 major facilitator superfamily MFS_1 [Microseira wollei NIES-4236]